jgi:hypothetical protein
MLMVGDIVVCHKVNMTTNKFNNLIKKIAQNESIVIVVDGEQG